MIEKDTLLKTAAGYILKVGEYIKSDRTFDYYKATYSLCPCVLKWYKNPGKKYKKLHKNVRMLTKLDYPYPYVALWPIDVTKIQNGSFGIITEELPDGYIPLSEAVKNLEDKDKCQCCTGIINTFKTYRKNKCALYAFNGPNGIYVNAKSTKNVMIDICVNLLAPKSKIPEFKGDPKYTAPEVYNRLKAPDEKSDVFSVAAVVFTVMFDINPFGNSEENDLQFVFEKDSSEKWEAAPLKVKKAFLSIFGKEGLQNPDKRCSYDDLSFAFNSWEYNLLESHKYIYLITDHSVSMSNYILKPWRIKQLNKKKSLFSKIFKRN